ncbi:MAG: hypothetical protein HY074_12490, partial [Deltaproteobacteria bacterium]|nr:hypothetical protein [Deltaproteobacteria bacterium]
MAAESRHKNLAFLLMLIVFLALTNKWMHWRAGLEYLQAVDIYSYEKIAAAAPHFPDEKIFSHLMHRFLIHYAIGSVSKLIQIPLHYCYRGIFLVLIALSLAAAHRLFSRLRLSQVSYCLCMALFVLNPYVFRYYAIVPGMAGDLLYIAGLGWALVGLVGGNLPLVAVAMIVSICGRQTGVQFYPGVAFWIVFSPAWIQKLGARRWSVVIALGVAVVVVYFGLGALLAPYSEHTALGRMFMGTRSVPLTPELVLEHIVRVLLPGVTTAGLILVVWRVLRAPFDFEAGAALTMVAGIISQPMLFDPMIVKQNEGRLGALGLLP